MRIISYDSEENILFLTKEKEVRISIDVGDFIVDVDHDGFVVGMEIMNASDNLNMTFSQLRSLKNASMTVTYKPKLVYVSLLLLFEGKQKDVSIPLTIDLGHEVMRTEKAKFAVV